MIPVETRINEIKSETITISYTIEFKIFGFTIYKRSYESTLVSTDPTIVPIGFNTLPDLKQYVDDERDFCD